jgi:hypothetical protein
MTNFKDRIIARELRANEGLSLGKIAKKLCRSKSTILCWTGDIQLTDEQKLQLKNNQSRRGIKCFGRNGSEHFLTRRKEFQQIGRGMVHEHGSGFIAGCMLYWAEGAKRRSNVSFVNCDANMVSYFVSFLRKYFDAQDDKFALRFDCYLENKTEDDIKKYWTELLNLNYSNIRKSVFKQHKEIGKNKHIYGACSLDYYDVSVVQKIYGAIQEIAQFTNPNWLY